MRGHRTLVYTLVPVPESWNIEETLIYIATEHRGVIYNILYVGVTYNVYYIYIATVHIGVNLLSFTGV